MAPYPNYRVEATNIVEYAKLGVTGYLAAGHHFPRCDMVELKTYVNARSMFDPFRTNASALVEEFARTHYGAAAAHVLDYLELMERSFQQSNRSLDFRGVPNPGADLGYQHITPTNAAYANDTLLGGGAILKAAQSAAGAEPYRRRVGAALMALQYIVLIRWDQLRGYCATAAAPACEWPYESHIADEFLLFETAYNESGVSTFTQLNADYHKDKDCDLEKFRRQILGGRDRAEGLRLPVKHDDDRSGAKAVENRVTTPSVEVFRHGMTAVCKCIRIPSIVLANRSVLVAFAECRHTWGDGCFPGNGSLPPAPAEQTSSLTSKRTRHVRSILGDIVMRRSLDPLGKSWSKISTLTESAGQPTAVCVARSGERRGGCRLIIFFVTSGGINMMMTSDDAGVSFTGPKEVTNAGARFPHTLMTGPGTAIQLHTGRIVSSGWTIVPRSPANPGGSGWHGVFFSDDNAETFSLSQTKIVGDGTGIDESTIAELSTGSLALFSRNFHNCSGLPVPQYSDGACIARTDSTDVRCALSLLRVRVSNLKCAYE